MLGLPATDPTRYTWEPVKAGDPDHMPPGQRLLHVVADRIQWQTALDQACRRAAEPDLPATGRAGLTGVQRDELLTVPRRARPQPPSRSAPWCPTSRPLATPNARSYPSGWTGSAAADDPGVPDPRGGDTQSRGVACRCHVASFWLGASAWPTGARRFAVSMRVSQSSYRSGCQPRSVVRSRNSPGPVSAQQASAAVSGSRRSAALFGGVAGHAAEHRPLALLPAHPRDAALAVAMTSDVLFIHLWYTTAGERYG
jgi:hypothetical protein